MAVAPTIFGWDTDEVFAYSTAKLVWIRDRYIGYLYYSMICTVLLWIIGFQIFWSNQHFLRKDVDGLARMWYSHPTHGNCDPALWNCRSEYKSLADLPYCNAYKGAEEYPQRAHCRFESKISLIPAGVKNNKLFIPTAVEVVTERKSCRPSEANGYTCDGEYKPLPGSHCLSPDGYMCQVRGNMTNQFYYIADVRNMNIRFTSSYERDNVRGTSLMHPAWVGICRARVRTEKTVREWSVRSMLASDSFCGEGDVELKMIPCKTGSGCMRLRTGGTGNRTGIAKWLLNRSGSLLDTAAHWTILADWLFNRGSGSAPGAAPAAAAARGSRPSGHARAVRRGGTATAEARATAGAAAADVEQSLVAEDAQPRRGQAFVQRGPATRVASLASEEEDTAGAARGVPEEPTAAPLTPEASKRDRAMHPVAITLKDEGAYSDQWGDVFKLGKLLELAGVDLDNDYNMDGWTTRQAGTALEVQVVYNNLYPIWSSFGYQPVMYHYEVRELMLPYFSNMELAPVQPQDYPATRRYEMQYGVMIRFKVGGAFGFFNLIFFFVMLATAFTTTAVAAVVTDCVGLYCHPRRDNFFHLKYQVSADFSNMWKCPRCGFYNELEYVTCKGLPAWTGPSETPECGTPRPLVAAGLSRTTAESRAARKAVRRTSLSSKEPRKSLEATAEEPEGAAPEEEPQVGAALGPSSSNRRRARQTSPGSSTSQDDPCSASDASEVLEPDTVSPREATARPNIPQTTARSAASRHSLLGKSTQAAEFEAQVREVGAATAAASASTGPSGWLPRHVMAPAPKAVGGGRPRLGSEPPSQSSSSASPRRAGQSSLRRPRRNRLRQDRTVTFGMEEADAAAAVSGEEPRGSGGAERPRPAVAVGAARREGRPRVAFGPEASIAGDEPQPAAQAEASPGKGTRASSSFS